MFRSAIELALPDVDGLDVEAIDSFLNMDAENGGSAAAAWPLLITSALPQLRGYSLAQMIALMVACAQQNRDGSVELRQCIEFFAGEAELSKAHVELGVGCVTRWDKDYGPHHDCLTGIGLAHWLHDLLLACPGALVWLGIQCSSFVLICKGVAKREAANEWLGNTNHKFVQEGNVQMQIASLIFLVATLIGCCPVIEQPISSVLPKLKPLATVLAFTKSMRTVTWMGAFQGNSPKPLQLLHTAKEYKALARKSPASMFPKDVLVTNLGTDKTGRRKFRGGKALKESQAYTAEFGRFVAVITKGLVCKK